LRVTPTPKKAANTKVKVEIKARDAKEEAVDYMTNGDARGRRREKFRYWSSDNDLMAVPSN
jgi:hypothetical protein